MELNLRGRTALVTGASKGIGLASAECLAAEGVNVILVSRTQADLDAARQKIMAAGMSTFRFMPTICRTRANVDKLVAEHAGIDILVNNAGAIPAGDLQQITEDRWRAGLGPESVRLHQHVPPLLCRNEIARPRRDHQRARRGRRENGPDLYRRFDRKRGADGVHQGAGRLRGRRQIAGRRHQSRARSPPIV